MANTGVKEFLNQLPVFPLFAGISLAFGLLVPTIFERSQEPAARSRHPEMERAAIIVLAVTMITIAICSYRGKLSTSERPLSSIETSRQFQFGLRGLLMAITLAAVLLAAALWMNREFASAVVIIAVIAILSGSFFRGWPVRSRTAALLASMFLPFTWMILYNRPFGYDSGLIEVLPISPAIVIAMLARGQIDDGAGIAASFIVLELVAGAWLVRRGGTLSLAFLVIVLGFSGFNSLVLHVLFRA